MRHYIVIEDDIEVNFYSEPFLNAEERAVKCAKEIVSRLNSNAYVEVVCRYGLNDPNYESDVSVWRNWGN